MRLPQSLVALATRRNVVTGMLSSAIVLALAGGRTANAGLLVNEGFEANTLGTTYGTWNENDLIPGWEFAPDSQYYAVTQVNNDAIAGKVGNNYLFEQFGTIQTAAMSRPAVTAGSTANLSLLFRHTGNNWTDTLAYIDFYDNNLSWNYTPVASSAALHLPNEYWSGFETMNGFAQFVTSAVVPTGATYVGVRFVTPDIWQNGVEFDNVQLSVPEPASLALVGCGSLLLLRKRRSM